MAEPLTPDARWAALDGNEAALRPLTREQVAIIVSDVRTRPHRHPATQCRLAVTLEAALAERDAAYAVIRKLLDYFDDRCRLDHHGYCQAHTLDNPCPVAAARDLIHTHTHTHTEDGTRMMQGLWPTEPGTATVALSDLPDPTGADTEDGTDGV